MGADRTSASTSREYDARIRTFIPGYEDDAGRRRPAPCARRSGAARRRSSISASARARSRRAVSTRSPSARMVGVDEDEGMLARRASRGSAGGLRTHPRQLRSGRPADAATRSSRRSRCTTCRPRARRLRLFRRLHRALAPWRRADQRRLLSGVDPAPGGRRSRRLAAHLEQSYPPDSARRTCAPGRRRITTRRSSTKSRLRRAGFTVDIAGAAGLRGDRGNEVFARDLGRTVMAIAHGGGRSDRRSRFHRASRIVSFAACAVASIVALRNRHPSVHLDRPSCSGTSSVK